MNPVTLTNLEDDVKGDVKSNVEANTKPQPSTARSAAQTIEQWLAKQPADHSIMVYLERRSLEILELRSEPRHSLPKILQSTSNQAAQYKTVTPHCLLRTGFNLAQHWAAAVENQEYLASLQSARLYLSYQTAELDRLITHVYEGLHATPPKKTLSPLALEALLGLVRDASERTGVKTPGQLLSALLKQRLALSQEMLHLDTAVQQLIGPVRVGYPHVGHPHV